MRSVIVDKSKPSDGSNFDVACTVPFGVEYTTVFGRPQPPQPVTINAKITKIAILLRPQPPTPFIKGDNPIPDLVVREITFVLPNLQNMILSSFLNRIITANYSERECKKSNKNFKNML
jgi:hypothetical protein